MSTRTCDNCGTPQPSTRYREYGLFYCDRCHEAQLDYGFLHMPEAFTCAVCGEQKRDAVARAGDDPICDACRATVHGGPDHGE